MVGYHHTGDRMNYWGPNGCVLGRAPGMIVPFGVLFRAGHRAFARGLNHRGVGRHGGGRRRERARSGAPWHGHPKNSIVQYETDVRNGKFVVIAYSTPEETLATRKTIGRTDPEAVDKHALPEASTEVELVGT